MNTNIAEICAEISKCNGLVTHGTYLLKKQAAKLFAEQRGWGLTHHFNLDTFAARRIHDAWSPSYWPHYNALQYDGRLFDHCDYYRESARPYRPIAVVSHTYILQEDLPPYIDAMAKCGLRVEQLAESWYYPGNAIALLFTHDPTREPLRTRMEDVPR